MPDLEWETVELQVQERVAWITLNRPDSMNAWTPQLGRDLLAVLDYVATDREVRAIVLTGAGRGFSSGADLKAGVWAAEDGKIDLGTPLRELFHPVILRLRRLEKPVIGAVNGAAVGIGCSLALAADIVVAAESAYFLLAFANVGLTLDGGGSALLVGRIGHARASEMGLLAERIGAEQALAWGLANRVVPDDELGAVAGELAARFAAGPPGSYASTKRSLNAAAYPNLAEILDFEATLQQERAESGDFLEGVRAFLEKRPAQFTGD
ncbi:MAG TPA: enoyl-CoA hydratase-related protein [Solirubrobacteraceae bacterium]|jgi:2-(1,2-epoxy-1,2-dihydrophenyl)acetyl-CoA isomerase|nr:enoyl-CoA hydratase-related protein [Solirubrobacteraceae bacterium]